MRALYQTLGVPEDASPEAIKSAYRALAMKHHPDKGGDAEKFGEITLAYDVLSDPERRKVYDETGVTGTPSEDSIESRALSIVAGIIDATLTACDAQGTDPATIDVIAHAEEGLRAQIKQLGQSKRDTEAQIERKKKILAKFSAKPGKTNRITPFIQAQARGLENRLAACIAEEKANILALDILLEHEFDFAQPVVLDYAQLGAFMQQARGGAWPSSW